jgi:hypothetical protein
VIFHFVDIDGIDDCFNNDITEILLKVAYQNIKIITDFNGTYRRVMFQQLSYNAKPLLVKTIQNHYW